jgi:inorganic triphosphatase YgiF
MDSGTGREYEVTLAIVSQTPERVGAEITALTAIGAYRILPSDLMTMRDVYLDTPAGDLGRRSWALRIRTRSGSVKFTLKGPASKTAEGVIERPELEDAWSREAPERIRAVLTEQGVRLDFRGSASDDVPPIDALQRWGFRTIQTRETLRELKRVVAPEGEVAVSDLAVDRVTYYLGTREIRHEEVEIEARGAEGAAATKAVADCLIAAYTPELRPWDYGKLATGLALEDLVQRGFLAGMIGPDGYVHPLAYERIIEWFKRAESAVEPLFVR